DREHVEAHADPPAILAVGRGEVAEDAVADAIALDIDRNIFRDGERARLRDANLAREIGDALARAGGKRETNERRCKDGGALHPAYFTFGTSRSAAFSISKNGAGLKAPKFATRFDG